jgi:putative lipoprotein
MQRIAWTLALLMTAWGCRVERPAESPRVDEVARPAAERRDPWREASARGIDFRAIGQEPGWYLEIDDGRSMRLVYDYGERNVVTPAPVAATDNAGTTYTGKTSTHVVTVIVEDSLCEDVMSGEPSPNTVTVTVEGRELRGCGRRLR